ncbi:MAG: pyrrolo-quinoline quinone [Clostridiales bacterium]|nr:MAG: pyrrolo-quinoline quinone [Clostridiales bacterium]
MKTDIMVNGEIVTEYSRTDKITFEEGEKYTDVKGVITFRGNNYRNTSGVYGTLNIVQKKFSDEPLWKQTTGSMQTMAGDGYWSGCGWTGQPLITEWPKSTRAIMAMYDWAKEQETLVEVIYATQDGRIYFYELETGKPTRDPIDCGFTFKGAGALDPRGIPLMYVGGGDRNPSYASPRVFVISLVTNEILYEFGHDDPFAMRSWCAFDSSALVDAETDTLIYPGENGVCYFVRLGTQYDEAAGTLTINPSDVVKWRYSGSRSSVGNKFWLGIEGSPIAYQGYLFFPDNGGYMMCLDINTLELVWVQDVLDDTNCTGVLEVENGKPYIYMSTSFHADWRADGDGMAPIPVWKIDAETGEIVWSTDYDCYTVSGNSGGAQGSLAAGKGTLEDIVYIPLGRTPDRWDGLLVALNKKTGKQVWALRLENYIWSSPALVYDAETGAGYVIQGDSEGNLFFIDGLTGEILNTFEMDGNIEATPAVYNDILVLGTRNCSIYAVRIE